MVACYLCNGGARDLETVLVEDNIHLCGFHNPMSDYNWKEDAEKPDVLIDFLLDLLDDEDIDRQNIEYMVDDKQDEYNGLVSRAAAVYLVAKDLGHPLLDSMEYDPNRTTIEQLNNCEINDDGFGLNQIEGEYKVRRVDSIDHGDEWIRADVVVYDDTGDIELTLWNDMAERAADLEADDIIAIEGGYVKKDDYGLGLNVSKKGRVVWPDGTETTGPDYSDG